MARVDDSLAAESDRGITLVELLVYMLLAIVVLTIVGSILINSFQAERQVRDAAQSNSTAQLVAESLGRGIRNASAVECPLSERTLFFCARVLWMAAMPAAGTARRG